MFIVKFSLHAASNYNVGLLHYCLSNTGRSFVLTRHLQLALHDTNTTGKVLGSSDPFSDHIIKWTPNEFSAEDRFKCGDAVLASPGAQMYRKM